MQKQKEVVRRIADEESDDGEDDESDDSPSLQKEKKGSSSDVSKVSSVKTYFFKCFQICLFLSPCVDFLNCLSLLILIQKRKESEESLSNPTDILTSSSAGGFSIFLWFPFFFR